MAKKIETRNTGRTEWYKVISSRPLTSGFLKNVAGPSGVSKENEPPQVKVTVCVCLRSLALTRCSVGSQEKSIG